MKKQLLFSAVTAFLLFTMCSKDESSDPQIIPVVDFGFSVKPDVNDNKQYVVSASDASNGVPKGVDYSWHLDGAFIDTKSSSFSSKYITNEDGFHTIVLTIKTSEGISYSKTKSFAIKDLTIISSDLPADTATKLIPEVNFGYGIKFTESSNYLSGQASCNNIPTSSTYNWILDGTSISTKEAFSSHSITKEDRAYSLVLNVTTPQGKIYSKTKSFLIRNNFVISEDFPLDSLINEVKPIVDFTYSLTYSYDSSKVVIGVVDASSNLNTSSYISNWYINGKQKSDGYSSSDFNNYSFDYSENGNYSINHIIIIGSIKYSKYKEFVVTGIK